MTAFDTREAILAETYRIAQGQPGGVLATIHSEDATPYVTYVLFHLTAGGQVLFGSGASPQHSQNMAATPEVSFLIDNREVMATDWKQFDRIVIEGKADLVADGMPEYQPLLDQIASKNAMAATFTARGNLYRITPRRIILRKGIQGVSYTVDFTEPD